MEQIVQWLSKKFISVRQTHRGSVNACLEAFWCKFHQIRHSISMFQLNTLQ